jgi:lipopolysaccharide export LptBFGC system permease protein LptF
MKKVLFLLVLVMVLMFVFSACSYELSEEQKDEIILDVYKNGDTEMARQKVMELYKDDIIKANNWLMTFKAEDDERYIYQLKILDNWTWTVEGNYSYIRGKIKNMSDKDIEYFEITAEYSDKNGNVIDSDYTNSGELLKIGNIKEFEIMHKDNKDYYRVNIFVNKVSTELK